MISVIEIGLTEGGLLSLSLLPVPVADPTDYQYHKGTDRRKASSGREIWAGFPWADLYWSVLEQLMRDQLRAFCPGESADIFVRLPINDDYSKLVIYSGLMIWPEDDPTPEYSKVYKFRLKFENLVPVT
jgi:hypothetical protein